MGSKVEVNTPNEKTFQTEHHQSENTVTANHVSKKFSVGELFKGIIKINQKIVQNYLNNHSAYHHDNRDIMLTYFSFYTKLFAQPKEMIKVQDFQLEFLQKRQALWQRIFIDPYFVKDKKENLPLIAPHPKDKRFNADQWIKYPYFDFLKQNHLLIEELAMRIIDEVEMGEPLKKRLDFYTKQYAELFSPSNFLFTNPEAIELAMETKGESLWNGFNNFVKDIEKGRITQVDETAFEVGKNLAITPGAVVYEDELIQLIQYSPVTKNVSEIPLIIIPPWINKYYILDLQPQNSFIKYTVARGFTVFVISWKNPPPGMGNLTFDNYVNEGAINAIEIARNISGKEKINVLGYCLGGTLLAVAASILAARKEKIINTLTFLAAMIDFSDIGPMGDVIDESLVSKLERGELLKDGVMHGNDMEKAFNLIRVKDMIWNYAVDNYLKGLPPPVFDVIYWTNDNTNLPATMYIYYMREMILKNMLVQKNALTICDTPIDIGKIDVPVFIIAMEKDYISPPQTVFVTSRLVSGPVEFILGQSGHVMGIANPPSKKKYGYYLNGKLGKGYEEWQKTATFHDGSWWTAWTEKLKEKSGKQIPAPKNLGNKKYKEIEPAPGTYVKEKCEICFPNSKTHKKTENKSVKSVEIPDTKLQNEPVLMEEIK